MANMVSAYCFNGYGMLQEIQLKDMLVLRSDFDFLDVMKCIAMGFD